MEKKITYTESGKNSLDKYLDEQKLLLEKFISDEKYVFGDDEIEITASDIKMYIDNSKYSKRRTERRKSLLFIINTYIIFGIIITIGGLIYPVILEMLEDRPFQFIITIMGVFMSIFAIIYKIYLKNRN